MLSQKSSKAAVDVLGMRLSTNYKGKFTEIMITETEAFGRQKTDPMSLVNMFNRKFPETLPKGPPHDLKYNGASTDVVIGDDNAIRECVTINRATHEGEQTRIGSGNLLMAYSHLGHNCLLGDRIVIANSVAVAGHVVIGDRAVIGGVLGIHQFVHIGTLAMVGGMSRIERDVPPFTLVEGF